jgi:hypothetical protein
MCKNFRVQSQSRPNRRQRHLLTRGSRLRIVLRGHRTFSAWDETAGTRKKQTFPRRGKTGQSTQMSIGLLRRLGTVIGVCSRSPSVAMLFEPRRNFGSDPCALFRKNGLEAASQGFECAPAVIPNLRLALAVKRRRLNRGLSVMDDDDFCSESTLALTIYARHVLLTLASTSH